MVLAFSFPFFFFFFRLFGDLFPINARAVLSVIHQASIDIRILPVSIPFRINGASIGMDITGSASFPSLKSAASAAAAASVTPRPPDSIPNQRYAQTYSRYFPFVVRHQNVFDEVEIPMVVLTVWPRWGTKGSQQLTKIVTDSTQHLIFP